MNRVQTLAVGSIVVGIVVLGLKYFAYHLTGSVALLSDAIESIVNVVTAVVALLAVRWSATPADDEHPYGHHKAEYFSAVIEGVLIILAALSSRGVFRLSRTKDFGGALGGPRSECCGGFHQRWMVVAFDAARAAA
jgi:cation diffusion facilitator family transporter